MRRQETCQNAVLLAQDSWHSISCTGCTAFPAQHAQHPYAQTFYSTPRYLSQIAALQLYRPLDLPSLAQNQHNPPAHKQTALVTLAAVLRCRGVADFEAYCADHKPEGITFEVLSALYEDPTDLEPISDTHMRLMARSLINKVTWGGMHCLLRGCRRQGGRGTGKVGPGE